jgi:hypothetical protein
MENMTLEATFRDRAADGLRQQDRFLAASTSQEASNEMGRNTMDSLEAPGA